MKLIPIRELINGKRILFCEDSIVRGTQLRKTIERLYELGVKEVHMRPACPPLIFDCPFLNFSRSRSELDLAGRRAINKLNGKNIMNPFCVTYANDILPVVKAMIAKKMMEDYKLSQNKIAMILNMTQPAISQYKRSLRGYKMNIIESNQKVLDLMEKITEELALGELSDSEKNLIYCRICKALREKD